MKKYFLWPFLEIFLSFQVIDFKSKTVKSYDSMGQRHDDVCSLLLWVLIVFLSFVIGTS